MRYARSDTRANLLRSIRFCESSTAAEACSASQSWRPERRSSWLPCGRSQSAGGPTRERATCCHSPSVSSDAGPSPGGAGPPSMSDPAAFLNSFAQALAVMTLYPDGHPSRERAIDAAYLALDGLASGRTDIPRSRFSTTKWCTGANVCAISESGIGAAASLLRESSGWNSSAR